MGRLDPAVSVSDMAYVLRRIPAIAELFGPDARELASLILAALEDRSVRNMLDALAEQRSRDLGDSRIPEDDLTLRVHPDAAALITRVLIISGNLPVELGRAGLPAPGTLYGIPVEENPSADEDWEITDARARRRAHGHLFRWSGR
jgi:hypothetical protein